MIPVGDQNAEFTNSRSTKETSLSLDLPLAVVVCATAFLIKILFPRGLNREARFAIDIVECV